MLNWDGPVILAGCERYKAKNDSRRYEITVDFQDGHRCFTLSGASTGYYWPLGAFPDLHSAKESAERLDLAFSRI